MREKIKAVALFSGGLDSILAIKIMEENGIDVTGVHFITPFCGKFKLEDCEEPQESIAKDAGIKLVHETIVEEYLEIVASPKFGYGKNMNPCIDCKILFLRKAWEIARKLEAKFLITGEVVNQRPMSQRRKIFKLMEKEAGVEGLVVRPLSGKILPPTIPEEKGWIKREWLLDISGRTRKPQLELKDYYGIKNFTQPAGGCLLTDPSFSIRLRELMENEGLDLVHISLLKVGRHFRLGRGVKLVVGRNQKENILLREYRKKFIYIDPQNTKGPEALLTGEVDEPTLTTALRIVARYCDRKNNVVLRVRREDRYEDITVNAMEPEEVERYRIS